MHNSNETRPLTLNVGPLLLRLLAMARPGEGTCIATLPLRAPPPSLVLPTLEGKHQSADIQAAEKTRQEKTLQFVENPIRQH